MRLAALCARRGSAYLAVLGASLIVAIIGVSALLAARIERRGIEGTNDAIQARIYAASAADVALLRVGSSPSWRQTLPEDTWLPELPIGRGTLTFKLVDELDHNLANDNTQPVRLYAKSRVGQAVRIQSVLLEAKTISNLLSNPGMGEGTTSWSGLSVCTLESRSDGPHGGTYYLRAKSRSSASAGPNQYITGKISSGTAYYTAVWAKMKDTVATIRVTIYTNSTDQGNQSFSLQVPSVGTAWTLVSGTITPTWTGTLNEARWSVGTLSSTNDLDIDDVLLADAALVGAGGTPKMTPAPGTWQKALADAD